MNNKTLPPIFFFGHGAAIFTMDSGESNHQDALRTGEKVRINQTIQHVMVLSAHNLHPSLQIGSSLHWETIHDHPSQNLYEFKYPAQGIPEIADMIAEHLKSKKFKVERSLLSGLDHGAWLALALLFPKADIKVTSVSLNTKLDPSWHWELGKALGELRTQGICLVASGSLTHNLSYFRECFHRAQEKSTPPDWALTFNEVAIKAISPATETQMKKSILGLFQHPLCPQNHPTTEHLMPFVVASGAASLGYETMTPFAKGWQHGLATDSILWV